MWSSVHDRNECPSQSPWRSACSSGSLHLCLINLEFTRIRREFCIAVSCAWSLQLWSTETSCLKFTFIKEHRVFPRCRIRLLTKQRTHVISEEIAKGIQGFIDSLSTKSGGGACRTRRTKKGFRVRCWRQSRKSVAGLGKCDGKCRDRRQSEIRSEIERPLSGASVDQLIFAERRGLRQCGGGREGVVQSRVQNSHPRRRCHLARGRGATREPITGTLSSPCAQSAPGQGKPPSRCFDRYFKESHERKAVEQNRKVAEICLSMRLKSKTLSHP